MDNIIFFDVILYIKRYYVNREIKSVYALQLLSQI